MTIANTQANKIRRKQAQARFMAEKDARPINWRGTTRALRREEMRRETAALKAVFVKPAE